MSTRVMGECLGMLGDGTELLENVVEWLDGLYDVKYSAALE